MKYNNLRYNKLFFVVFLLIMISISGCSSLKFIFCGNSVCDPGEEETCPEDCKEKPSISPKTINDVLSEGQSMTYEFNGYDYELKVLIINDEIGPRSVKLNIDGNLIPLLKAGDIYTLDDGINIEIKDIMVNKVVNSTIDIVEFTLGDDIHDFMKEGESRIYTIDEKDYFIKTIIISDVIDPDSVVKFAVNGKPIKSLKVNKNSFMDGFKLEVNGIMPNKADDPIADLVEFTLNNKEKDILEEGENTTYNLDGKDYNVHVLTIGDNGHIDPSARLAVDGITTDTLYVGSSIILEDSTVLKIEDIIPNELEEKKGNLIEISLDGKFGGIVNNEHSPKNLHINKEKNYKVSVVSFNKGKEKKLTEKIESVKFLINNRISDRLYESQDLEVDDSCNIRINRILTPGIEETDIDKVDFTFSCA